MKYKKLSGIILKKQNYREADQILTTWTKEAGKIRVLARSLRSPKSKLVYSLQDLSFVQIEITGSKGLPTLISAKPINSFKRIKDDLPKIAAGLYAAELIMKMTGDEHANQPAFDLLFSFLATLDAEQDLTKVFDLVDQFSLDLIVALGFGKPKKSSSHKDVKNFIESILERNLRSEQFLTASRC